jgi:hypothetical protein
MMAKIKAQFWSKLMGGEEESKEAPKTKALKYDMDLIESVEFVSCDFTLVLVQTVHKFLEACASSC